MKKLILALLLSGIPLCAQTTTTYTGTIKDLTGATVTSGRITWTLNAPSGGVIPGTGSFIASTVSCLINASGAPVSSSDGVSACVITNNTALTPTGTSYTLCIQPYNVTPGSCFTTFATGGTANISNLVPTPATQPNYGLASLGANQTFQGVVTFANPIVGATTGNMTNAGGTFTGPVNGPNGNFTNSSYQSVDVFSDSIAQGAGATTFMAPGIKGQNTCWIGNSDWAAACYSNGPTAWVYRLQADFANGGHDYGFGGDMAADASLKVAVWSHPGPQQNPVRLGEIGTNDNSTYGTNTNQQDTTLKAELFMAAHSLIPETLKTYANSSTCTTTGAWTADTNIPGAMFTTTNGASLSCPSVSSTAFTYIAYLKCDNTSSGTGSVLVNSSAGSLESTLNFFGLGGSAILTANGSHCALALARNSGLAGANITKVTATNGGTVEVYWFGGPYVAPAGAVAPPLYVQNGVPLQAANAGQPGVGQYNAISNSVYTTLLADGNNILWADVEAQMNTTIDFTGGTQASGDSICGKLSYNGTPWAATWLSPLHPGDGGHCHIYEADALLLNPQPKSGQVSQMWAGPYGTITSSGSRQGKDGSATSGARTALTLTNTANPGAAGSAGRGGGSFLGVADCVPATFDPTSFGLSSTGALNTTGANIMAYSNCASSTGAARLIAEAAGGGGNIPAVYLINDAAPTTMRNWQMLVDVNGVFHIQNCNDSFGVCADSFGSSTSQAFVANLGIGTTLPSTIAGVPTNGNFVHTFFTGTPSTGASGFIAEATGGGTNTPNFYWINNTAPTGQRNWLAQVNVSGNWTLNYCTNNYSGCANALTAAGSNGALTTPNNTLDDGTGAATFSKTATAANFKNSQTVTISLLPGAGSTATLGGTSGCVTGIVCDPNGGGVQYSVSGAGIAAADQFKIVWAAAMPHIARCVFNGYDNTASAPFMNFVLDAGTATSTQSVALAGVAPTTAHTYTIYYQCN